MEDYSRFSFDPITRKILLNVGKVEIGQHVHSAFLVIVSDALKIDKSRLGLTAVSTQSSPDDGLTAGSLSVQITGALLHSAALSLRSNLTKEAARWLESDIDNVILDSETLEFSTPHKRCSLFDLPMTKTAIGTSNGGDFETSSTIPTSIQGTRSYIQDMNLPGMLHARALRGRKFSTDFDETVRVIRDLGFSALVAVSPGALEHAWKQVANELPERDSSCDGPVSTWIYNRCVKSKTMGDTSVIENDISQTASRPFLLHASIAPSCAIAQFKNGVLEIWTHSQGIFPLRDTIARQTKLNPDKVIVRHVPSAGSYGHNAADDVAMDAVLISLQTDSMPVRVTWTRQDEFQFSPVGAPMSVQVEARLADDKSIESWRQTIWSGPHGQRPGNSGNVNLLASIDQDPANRSSAINDLPEKVGGGAARNAKPPYAIASLGVTTHLIQDLPVKTSSLRGLGAHMNVVCIESVIDQLAEQCATDPLDFRITNIEDPRGKEVLLSLKSILNAACLTLDEDESIGVSYSRYKDKAAYAAVAIKIRLTEIVELLDVWTVVDAGRIVDESGALNQIEGGFIQAASWTISEGALLRNGYIDAKGWEDYPILSWSNIPTIHSVLLNANSQLPSLGIGECMVGPASAAIVNGVRNIAGSTLANLPLTRDKFISEAAAPLQ